MGNIFSIYHDVTAGQNTLNEFLAHNCHSFYSLALYGQVFLVIQASAGALNLTIHIQNLIQDLQRLLISLRLAQRLILLWVINIGYLDEIHYVSTIPFNEEAIADNEICNNQYHNQISLTQNAMLTH